MTLIERAQEFLSKVADLPREAARALWKEADPEVAKEASRLRKESFFTEENRLPDKRREEMSPDGSYRLVIDYYTTGKGTWNYSRGRVYHFNGWNPIADVKRNYSSFPFSWIEHPNGNCYLYCGADYQGQTFIDLGKGERRDTMSGGADKGWGFCWAKHQPAPAGSTFFAVEGCYWACPYEVWAFDITDPMHPKLLFRKDGDFVEWESENSFRIANFQYDEVSLPGHPLHGKSENYLTIEDLNEVEREARERGLDPNDDDDAEKIWVEKYDGERTVTLPDDANIEEES
jgi:hypothetical protein